MNEATLSAPLAQSGAVLRCLNLVKSFKSQAETLRVLRGVDMELRAGCSASIMGASGSGKSTLLSIIGGLENFDSGELWVGDYALHRLSEKELPRYRSELVGFVFQFHHLLKDFSALENVALPAYMRGTPRAEAWARAETLLEKVGLAERKNHFPSELSGGERQRAAIARALVNNPLVVLADEPTGNLDASNAAAVRDLLFSLPALAGTTLIVATHDRGLAEKAEAGYLLEEGRLKAL